jgi:molecular chaperone Hsp33
VRAAGSVTGLLDRNPDPEAMLQAVLADFALRPLERTPVAYRCTCSRARMARALVSLGERELRDLIEQQKEGTELSCRFCGRVERFSRKDLEALLQTALQKKS